ncbi:p-type cation-transporting protein [Cyclospora cayetanensis]|uniref:P-type cation-transporting protein n=1 Tax=Cyclospora cayetanensis TaxID=88456 RepID=A0A1D3CZR1_9EIME|nr:p-type cation-transporting protein [Cyclospora cayetanensis]
MENTSKDTETEVAAERGAPQGTGKLDTEEGLPGVGAPLVDSPAEAGDGGPQVGAPGVLTRAAEAHRGPVAGFFSFSLSLALGIADRRSHEGPKRRLTRNTPDRHVGEEKTPSTTVLLWEPRGGVPVGREFPIETDRDGELGAAQAAPGVIAGEAVRLPQQKHEQHRQQEGPPGNTAAAPPPPGDKAVRDWGPPSHEAPPMGSSDLHRSLSRCDPLVRAPSSGICGSTNTPWGKQDTRLRRRVSGAATEAPTGAVRSCSGTCGRCVDGRRSVSSFPMRDPPVFSGAHLWGPLGVPQAPPPLPERGSLDLAAPFGLLELEGDREFATSIYERSANLWEQHASNLHRGYRRSLHGSLCFCICCILLLLLVTALLLCVWREAVTSVSEPEEAWRARAKPFICLWCFSLVTFFSLQVFSAFLPSCFLLRAPLETCEYLQLLEKPLAEREASDREGSLSPPLPRVGGPAAEFNRIISKLKECFFLFCLFVLFGRTGPQETSPPSLVPVQQEYRQQRAAHGQRDTQEGCPQDEGQPVRYVIRQHRRYLFSRKAQTFVPTYSELPEVKCGAAKVQGCVEAGGLGEAEAAALLKSCGPNTVPVEQPSLIELLKGEARDPVNLLQIFLLLNSLFWRSYISSSLWVLLGVSAALRKALLAYRSQQSVRGLLQTLDTQTVLVLRGNSPSNLKAADLVPGDVVLLQQGTACPADLLLVRGSAVVDEADFTGEAAPVERIPVEVLSHPKDAHSLQRHADCETGAQRLARLHANSLIHAGSRIIAVTGCGLAQAKASTPMSHPEGESPAAQARNMPRETTEGEEEGSVAVGVVLRTGASTSRGQQMQRLLFPSLVGLKYDLHLPAVFVILLCYALIVVFTICSNSPNATGIAGWFYAVSTLSQLLPVWTPVLLASAQAAAARRLLSSGLLTAAPQRVAVCGKVRVVCFDKTGTLTQHRLKCTGIIPTPKEPSGEFPTEPVKTLTHLSDNDGEFARLCRASAGCCHSLTMFHGAHGDREPTLVGGALEIELLRASGWRLMDSSPRCAACGNEVESRRRRVLVEGEDATTLSAVEAACAAGNPEVAVASGGLECLRAFPFDFRLKRQSCLLRASHKTLASLLPPDHPALKNASAESPPLLGLCKGSLDAVAALCPGGLPQGCREKGTVCSSCTAFAAAKQVTREAVESDLTFLGLLLLSNELRADAKETIMQLREARVRPVMVTGDSIFTAAAVGMRCGMLTAAPTAAQRETMHGSDMVLREGNVKVGSSEQEPALLLGEAAQGATCVVWTDLRTRREIPQTEVLSKPEIWPELAITEGAFDILRNEPLLLGVAATTKKQHQHTEEENLEENPLLLVNGEKPQRHDNEKQFPTGSVLDVLLMRIRIFGRTTPNGKSRVVRAFMDSGLFVLMCGDGANDSAALRTAHVGLALSKASQPSGDFLPFSAASIAAPFTATSMRPSAVISLLKEGRCSLATSLAAYKFMVLYGLLLSMAKVVLLVAAGGSCMSQVLYLTVDVGVLLGISNLMVLARPKEQLRIRSPTSSLLGPTTITSLCLMLAINAAFLVTLYCRLLQKGHEVGNSGAYTSSAIICSGLGMDLGYLQELPRQAWWMRSDNYEAASLSIWVTAQLVNAGMVFSLGGTHRKRLCSNWPLIAYGDSFHTYFSTAASVGATAATAFAVPSSLFCKSTEASSSGLSCAQLHSGSAKSSVEELKTHWVVQMRKHIIRAFFWNLVMPSVLFRVCCGLHALLIGLVLMPPNTLGCLYRINCTDELSRSLDLPLPAWASRAATRMPLYNPQGHTLFPASWKASSDIGCPLHFRVELLALTYLNVAANFLAAKALNARVVNTQIRRLFRTPGDSADLRV